MNNIPTPIFTPVLDTNSDHTAIIENHIKWNREDEKKVCADRYVSRMRKLQIYVLTEKPDYAAISLLLESEIEHIECQILGN